MKFNQVKIDCNRIRSADDFHDLFAETFDFPFYYGRNMDAWIDCMSDYDPSSDGFLVLELENVETLMRNNPDIYADLVECSAFVNLHRFPMMCLAFHNKSA